MINMKILQRVAQIEAEKAYEKRCINVNICPKCGSENTFIDIGSEFTIQLQCPKCQYTTARTIL